ncbi:cytochrome c maturation protein CcmE [Cellvibrio japonicus]|uniref:Cytochrome c-type biogenesis protein CcmE n=1 Tax=Cellvibrio japonicus (strain Ueda107) TaxID=498211 RepID=CCME_CELJU|nr:cytochrome c maturation protein CcmE [Cellvibrio japonicus]B3PIC5.1 RecName: Full=Cytochrome c-type biogenesis protein CcmE; AltName: Full=Cytochrome c maturation protein E; AltName: Full=Heme chaperone CcmE [Cellvibrio japonicus Ueda107]ACE85227.1 CycJ [Cellvibrio japonicus Ueda107]QEI12527.1 cytochrome c maturation protein CcmE [Cellvibrio japonicus]QEI16101.1 cytochrome c maturation protein CcmE [Cellvibrio japonicus]QEI19679.1 cytochrome c maturation protein CcmE [Cellvibrio japonicus]
MHPQRKQRLMIVLFIVVFSSLAVGLIAYALRENINLFYPPSKIAAGDVPHNTRIRAGGCVKPGSVVRSQENLDVRFVITDGNADVVVSYTGILPDLFAEGEAAVINGIVTEAGDIQASEVLAKHDETYMPPEVAEAMKGKGQHQATCGGLNYGA